LVQKILNRIFKQRLHFVSIADPFVNYKISLLGDYKGVNDAKRENLLYVVLSSNYEQFKDLPKTIYSLLNQSLKPDKIVLYLNKEHEDLVSLPYEITQFIKNGLEIQFVEDIQAYTPIINAFKNFPEAIIVTAENNIYYSKGWLENLYLSYILNPDDIQVCRADKVEVLNGKVKSITKSNDTIKERASYSNFINNLYGVLFPPKCFGKEVLRQDVFMKYSPKNPQIWLWIMALVHKRKIRVVNNGLSTFSYINLWKEIFNRNQNKNSKQELELEIHNLIKLYSNRVLQLFDE